MNPALLDMIDESADRYLSDEEQRRLLAYTESLPRRLAALTSARAAEGTVVLAAERDLRGRFPDLFKNYPDLAEELVTRDLPLVLRYSVQAMLCDDPTFQRERLLSWLARTYAGLGHAPGFLSEAYTVLKDRLRDHIPADSFELLEPFMDINVNYLGGGEEPLTPLLVGGTAHD